MLIKIFAVAFGVITFGIGSFAGNWGKTQPVKPQGTGLIPVSRVIRFDPLTIRPSRVDAKEEKRQVRAEIIAQVVRDYHRYKKEMNQASRFEAKSADSLAGEIQYLYDYGDRFAEIRKIVEVNQLTPEEIGIDHHTLRRTESWVYKQVLNGMKTLQQKGGANRCLWEGGCFSDDQEMRRIDGALSMKIILLE